MPRGAHAACVVGLIGSAIVAAAPPPAAPSKAAPPTLPAREASAREVQLGRQLFFERRLSADATMNCASCHRPDRGYADGLPLSKGYSGALHFRNAKSLLYVARRTRWFWDGRGESLTSAVAQHITDASIFAAHPQVIVQRLRHIPRYVEAFAAAYSAEPSFERLQQALAAYLASLSGPVPSRPRSALAREGEALFESEGCATCHAGEAFSDGRPHPGRSAAAGGLRDPLRLVALRAHIFGLGMGDGRAESADRGVYYLSRRSEQASHFVTPSLLAVSSNAPYMHDGSVATLEEAIRRCGEAARAVPQPGSGAVQPRLSRAAERRLAAFLRQLGEAPKPSDSGGAEDWPYAARGVAP